MWRNWNLQSLLVVMENNAATSVNNMAIPQEYKYIATIRLNSFTQECENIHKNL